MKRTLERGSKEPETAKEEADVNPFFKKKRGLCPTRLETRAKETNIFASLMGIRKPLGVVKAIYKKGRGSTKIC